MNVLTAFQTQNSCYKAAKPMTPKGIIVHSTGANNPNLKRYVDAEAELGKNVYGNTWNNGTIQKCPHGWVGYDKNKQVRAVQVLPYTIACWGCGKGSKGSYNYNPTGHIQFEICEDGLTDEAYFNKAFDAAAEYCAILCKQFNLSVDTIVSHAEAAKLGYASNHGDPDHWLEKFGKTMDWFRDQVRAKLGTASTSTSKPSTSTSVYKAGQELQLRNVKLYSSSTVTTAARTLYGTYYLWSSDIVNGRIRVTNRANIVGMSGMVTGWVNVADIGGSEAEKEVSGGVIYRVQAGAFTDKKNAEALVEKLKKAGFSAIITATATK